MKITECDLLRINDKWFEWQNKNESKRNAVDDFERFHLRFSERREGCT